MGSWRAKRGGGGGRGTLQRPEGARARRVVTSAVRLAVLSSGAGAGQGAGGQSPGQQPRPRPPSGEPNLEAAGPGPLRKGGVSWRR